MDTNKLTLQEAVDSLINDSDQLDITDARQQDEIDYLRKRIELLEITINTTIKKWTPIN
tara:strand:+ start:48 stop:224 length:177 start_codon:yes stop_codon:yes gene_type:complete